MQKTIFIKLESISFYLKTAKAQTDVKMNETNSKTHFFLIPIGVFLCQERERKQIFFEASRENKQEAHKL